MSFLCRRQLTKDKAPTFDQFFRTLQLENRKIRHENLNSGFTEIERILKISQKLTNQTIYFHYKTNKTFINCTISTGMQNFRSSTANVGAYKGQ